MDNELDGTTSQFIKNHLAECPQCRQYLSGFRGIDNMVWVLPRVVPAPDFSQRVIEAALSTEQAVDRAPLSLFSRLQFALMRLSEEIVGLFQPGFRLHISTLEEFSDSPPLSMGFIYLRLIEQPKTRVLT